ncbi:hypothetical protein KHA80_13480 [Anaerobacillus sp. HL2]|nr:hypothetical protein KHA80_13480 [Anaerobacillus sp. HL2]
MENFHTRVYDIVNDLFSPIFPSLIAALLLSVTIVEAWDYYSTRYYRFIFVCLFGYLTNRDKPAGFHQLIREV